MARYSLNVRNGSKLLEDPEGSELASLDEAREEASKSARQMLAEKVLADDVIDGQVFEITDVTGAVQATVPLKSVLRQECAAPS